MLTNNAVQIYSKNLFVINDINFNWLLTSKIFKINYKYLHSVPSFYV